MPCLTKLLLCELGPAGRAGNITGCNRLSIYSFHPPFHTYFIPKHKENTATKAPLLYKTMLPFDKITIAHKYPTSIHIKCAKQIVERSL